MSGCIDGFESSNICPLLGIVRYEGCQVSSCSGSTLQLLVVQILLHCVNKQEVTGLDILGSIYHDLHFNVRIS